VWDDPPPKIRPLPSSLSFSAGVCVFIAVICATWWYRDITVARQVVLLAVMTVPLAALWLWVSLRLPRGTASWKALLPGAYLVAVGFQVVHAMVVWLLGPKLDHATSLYGGLGIAATLLFFMWVVGRIVVTAPILNSALYGELRGRDGVSRT
jgi:uncharacterized BrkB/YihY/UPF0761 family membrane protein